MSTISGFHGLGFMNVEVSDLDHPRGVKKSKKIPPKSGSPAWFLVLFGHPILAWGYDQDSTHLEIQVDIDKLLNNNPQYKVARKVAVFLLVES